MSHHCNQNQPFPELRALLPLLSLSNSQDFIEITVLKYNSFQTELSKFLQSSITLCKDANQTCSSPFQVLVQSYQRQNPSLISFLLLLPTPASFLPVFPNLLHILLFQEVLLDWSLSSLGKQTQLCPTTQLCCHRSIHGISCPKLSESLCPCFCLSWGRGQLVSGMFALSIPPELEPLLKAKGHAISFL